MGVTLERPVGQGLDIRITDPFNLQQVHNGHQLEQCLVNGLTHNRSA